MRKLNIGLFVAAAIAVVSCKGGAQMKNETGGPANKAELCKKLTPEYVNTASGLELHQFKWLDSDRLIGELPDRWNHLVGYNARRRDASLVHYTLGGPYFAEYSACEYADEWRAERDAMLHAGGRAFAGAATSRAE